MDKRLLKTLALAENSTYPIRNKKMCAVLWYKNTKLAVGYNSRTTHPLQTKWAALAGQPFKICLHAEVACIAQALRLGITNLNKCTMTVARLAGNLHGCAKPCPVCSKLLNSLDVKVIHT